jgi:hypothetical protein
MTQVTEEFFCVYWGRQPGIYYSLSAACLQFGGVINAALMSHFKEEIIVKFPSLNEATKAWLEEFEMEDNWEKEDYVVVKSAFKTTKLCDPTIAPRFGRVYGNKIPLICGNPCNEDEEPEEPETNEEIPDTLPSREFAKKITVACPRLIKPNLVGVTKPKPSLKKEVKELMAMASYYNSFPTRTTPK